MAEPAEGQQDVLDCLDVGYATVDVKELLRTGRDLSEKDIPGKTFFAPIAERTRVFQFTDWTPMAK